MTHNHDSNITMPFGDERDIVANIADEAIKLLEDCKSFYVRRPGKEAHFSKEVAAEIARRAKGFTELMGIVDDVRPIMGPAVDLSMTIGETEFAEAVALRDVSVLRVALYTLVQYSADAVAGGGKEREALAAHLRQIRSRIDDGEFD
jgi:hypothetical protein